MSDEKPQKDQLNEIPNRKQGGELFEKALPLRQPPASLVKPEATTSESNADNSTKTSSNDKSEK